MPRRPKMWAATSKAEGVSDLSLLPAGESAGAETSMIAVESEAGMESPEVEEGLLCCLLRETVVMVRRQECARVAGLYAGISR